MKQLRFVEAMIISKYFNNAQDFINLSKTNKEYKDIPNNYYYNPIPLTQKCLKLFSNIETIHIYENEDRKENEIEIKINKIKKCKICSIKVNNENNENVIYWPNTRLNEICNDFKYKNIVYPKNNYLHHTSTFYQDLNKC